MKRYLAKRHHAPKCSDLTRRANRTLEYFYDAFIDESAIKMFDAQALNDVPPQAQKFLSNQSSPSNFYTSIGGEPSLLRSLSKLAYHQRLGFQEPENILVTAGAVNAFSALCYALCDPGDVILTLSPSYILLAHSPELFHATMELVPSVRSDKFRVSSAQLEEEIRKHQARGKRVKAVLVVNPTNIDGQCWTREQIDEITPVLEAHDLLLIEDRVYDGTQFDPPEDAAFFAHHPKLTSRTATIDSVSKRYGATQWRVGWLIADSTIVEAARSFVLQSVWSPNSLYQKAAALMIDSSLDDIPCNWAKEYLQDTCKEYRLRRDLCLLLLHGEERYEALADRYRLTSSHVLRRHYAGALEGCELVQAGSSHLYAPIIPQAAMFLLIGFSDAVWRALPKGLSHADLALGRYIYLEEKVAMIPPSELTLPEEEKLFRLEYGVSVEDIVQCFVRLDRVTRRIAQRNALSPQLSLSSPPPARSRSGSPNLAKYTGMSG